jgi:hypothetical protein
MVNTRRVTTAIPDGQNRAGYAQIRRCRNKNLGKAQVSNQYQSWRDWLPLPCGNEAAAAASGPPNGSVMAPWGRTPPERMGGGPEPSSPRSDDCS